MRIPRGVAPALAVLEAAARRRAHVGGRGAHAERPGRCLTPTHPHAGHPRAVPHTLTHRHTALSAEVRQAVPPPHGSPEGNASHACTHTHTHGSPEGSASHTDMAPPTQVGQAVPPPTPTWVTRGQYLTHTVLPVQVGQAVPHTYASTQVTRGQGLTHTHTPRHTHSGASLADPV